MNVSLWLPIVGTLLGGLGGTWLGYWLQARRADREYERIRADRERERWLDVKRSLYAEFTSAARAARAVILDEPLDDVSYALAGTKRTPPEAAGNLSRLYQDLQLIAPAEVTEPASRLMDLTGRILVELAERRGIINRASEGDERDQEVLGEYWARRGEAFRLVGVVRKAMRRDLGLPVDMDGGQADVLEPRRAACDG